MTAADPTSDGTAAPPERPATGPRIVLLAVSIAVCAGTAFAVIPPVRFGHLNGTLSGAIGLLTMIVLSVPFLWGQFARPGKFRSTRAAWILCVIMALDHVLIGLLATGLSTSGHPPLEAVLVLGLGVFKLAAIPTAAALLCFACLRGERLALIVAGFLCLLAEAVVSALIL